MTRLWTHRICEKTITNYVILNFYEGMKCKHIEEGMFETQITGKLQLLEGPGLGYDYGKQYLQLMEINMRRQFQRGGQFVDRPPINSLLGQFIGIYQYIQVT